MGIKLSKPFVSVRELGIHNLTVGKVYQLYSLDGEKLHDSNLYMCIQNNDLQIVGILSLETGRLGTMEEWSRRKWKFREVGKDEKVELNK